VGWFQACEVAVGGGRQSTQAQLVLRKHSATLKTCTLPCSGHLVADLACQWCALVPFQPRPPVEFFVWRVRGDSSCHIWIYIQHWVGSSQDKEGHRNKLIPEGELWQAGLLNSAPFLVLE
jgi:hypothetical protein